MIIMKKIFFNVASGVMFSLALVGCQDDFLNTTPLSEIAESNVWSSAKLAEAAVLDLYQGTWAGTLTREETTDAFTDQAVFTHPGRGVDGYLRMVMSSKGMLITGVTHLITMMGGGTICLQCLEMRRKKEKKMKVKLNHPRNARKRGKIMSLAC